MKIPFTIDLSNSAAVLTGGAGILCSTFAEALALCGCKVAILDINKEAAQKEAEKIKKRGGRVIVVKANVLDTHSLQNAKEKVLKEFGSYNILINGAGGNHPKGTTTHEILTKKDLTEKSSDLITFFDLEREGVDFVG